MELVGMEHHTHMAKQWPFYTEPSTVRLFLTRPPVSGMTVFTQGLGLLTNPGFPLILLAHLTR